MAYNDMLATWPVTWCHDLRVRVVIRTLTASSTCPFRYPNSHHVGQVFVTGGIGGVHRGGETSMDVSADLTELARTPVAVFCAGAKSVLDIPRTLEYLVCWRLMS